MEDRLMNCTLAMLNMNFREVAELDFTHDQYDILWCCDDNYISSLPHGLSECISYLADHSDEYSPNFESVLKSMNGQDIARHLRESDSMSFHVRSKSAGWLSITLMKASSFGERNVIVSLFIQKLDTFCGNIIDNSLETRRLAEFDALTGFRNRHSYEAAIRCDLNTSFGVIYLDLNYLKTINDTVGHTAGDSYIKEFAEMLSSIFRKDECYRIGGDEFVIILEGISMKSFESRKNSLIEANRGISRNFPFSSIGFDWNNGSSTLAESIIRAEKMMYESKRDMKSFSLRR